VDVFDSDLETVESTRFRDLNFFHESSGEIFEDDTVGGGEEGEDMGNEVAFAVGEVVPVLKIGGKIDFFGGPERSFGFFVHFPDFWVLDWEHTESVWVWSEKRFFWERRHCLVLGIGKK